MVVLSKESGAFLVEAVIRKHDKIRSDTKNCMGNNPMVGATVALAVAIEEASR